ncbi:MAG: hypothetical protein H0X24_24395, partial [Ktedonobacterales bacterium]|nr:hypothetical protein [Ktedonobacterales bacterium]
NYTVRPKPNGRARLVDMGAQRVARSRSELDSGRTLKWNGWSLRRYFAPNRLPGGEVAVPNNLLFIFRYGNEVQVRVKRAKRRDPGAQWQLDSRTLSAADGPETVVDRSRLSFTEGGQKTDLQFDQGMAGASGPPASNDIRDRLGNMAEKLPGRGPVRRD